MKKVLQVSMGEKFGGIEKLELEYLKYLNTKFQFDFLTPNKFAFKNYEKEIKKLNGNLYNFNLSRKTIKGRIKYIFKLQSFLKKNKYDIIHINSSVFLFSLSVVFIAKLCKIKKIIVHSHSIPHISKLKRLIINILNPLYRTMIDEYLSCSDIAMNSLFTKNFIKKGKIKVLKNGIDVKKYKFNLNTRKKYLKKLNLEDKIIYGNVSRFTSEKNHDLLIDIFYEIQKKQKNSILLLIGDGELEDKIKDKVNNLKITDKVIFLGFREDAYNYLNCMDIFIFPSYHEGLGISLIESQTNGLITYTSTNVPKEVNISNKIRYFKIEDNASDIAKEILKEKLTLKEREKEYINTINSGYEIEKTCKELEKIYK